MPLFTFGANEAFLVGHEALNVLDQKCTFLWKDNARENACIFSLSFFYNRAVFKHVFYSERVPACLPLFESITAGAISFEDSEVNFIGNFSFEGNHANDRGGKIRGNLTTANSTSSAMFR